MTELKPIARGWISVPIDGTPIGDDVKRGHRDAGGQRFRIYGASAWQKGRVKVISGLEDAERDANPQRIEPHYHLSISAHPEQPHTAEVMDALADFGVKWQGRRLIAEWPGPGGVAVQVWDPVWR